MPRTVEQTVFKFDELSERAKKRARDRYREHGISYGWWDYIYDDAVACAACLGITVATRTVKLHGGGTRQDPNIWFTGFYSQGDGAMFIGRYEHKAGACEAIAKHAPQDKELATIAAELTQLQLTVRLQHGCLLEAEITSSRSNYCHSGCMAFATWYTRGGLLVDNSAPPDEVVKALTALLRRFADWIYSQLEQEYDYLTSDEHVDERLADDEFDEDGNLI